MRATGERDERVEITWMRVSVAYVYKFLPLFGGPQSYIISFCTHHAAYSIISKRRLRPRCTNNLTRGAVARLAAMVTNSLLPREIIPRVAALRMESIKPLRLVGVSAQGNVSIRW